MLPIGHEASARNLAIDREAVGHDADGGRQLESLHEVGGLADALLPVLWRGGHEAGIEAGTAADGEDTSAPERPTECHLTDVDRPRPGRPEDRRGRPGRQWQAQHRGQLVAGPGRHDAERHVRPKQQLCDVPQRPIAAHAEDGAHSFCERGLHCRAGVCLGGRHHDARGDAVPAGDRLLDVCDDASACRRVAQLGGIGVDDDKAASGFHPRHSVAAVDQVAPAPLKCRWPSSAVRPAELPRPVARHT
jgi:hypothetical protein